MTRITGKSSLIIIESRTSLQLPRRQYTADGTNALRALVNSIRNSCLNQRNDLVFLFGHMGFPQPSPQVIAMATYPSQRSICRTILFVLSF